MIGAKRLQPTLERRQIAHDIRAEVVALDHGVDFPCGLAVRLRMVEEVVVFDEGVDGFDHRFGHDRSGRIGAPVHFVG